MHSLFISSCFACLILLISCAERPTSNISDNRQTTSSGAAVSDAERLARETATSPDLPVEADQIEFTRNVDPSTLDNNDLPESVVINPDFGGKMETSEVDVVPVKTSDMATGNIQLVERPGSAPKKEGTSPIEKGAEFPDEASTIPLTTNSSPAPAPNANKEREEAKNDPPPPNHGTWNTLLQRHVTNTGAVNYAGFKNDLGELNGYLAELKKSAPTDSWSREEAMAYWINAYNAFTIKRILNDYPLSSIQDLDGGDPWKVKWIDIDGKSYSLNNIEHDILRPKYDDARIHFAVNCAAKSCPPIPNKAFTANNLNRMLESNARAFIRNTDYNQTSGQVRVSKIFDWYGKDFGDLRSYLNKYLATPIAAGTDIGFKDYDWSLNKQ